MDHLGPLLLQHQSILNHLREARDAADPAQRERKLDAAARQIGFHVFLEERWLYPALQGYETRRASLVAIWQEHELIREEVETVKRYAGDEREFSRRISALIGRVEDHLEDEERHVFADARKLVSETRLREIEQGLREEIVSRGKAA